MSWEQAIASAFPAAMQGSECTRKVVNFLYTEGFTPENTIFGTSTCPDEINRTVTYFSNHYGENFIMGGLAGYPFAGLSGFHAFLHHAPDFGPDKHLFLLYGPHLGVLEKGTFGKVHRPGMKEPTTACGSACAAFAQIKSDWEAGNVSTPHFNPLDPQQYWIHRLLTRKLRRIIDDPQPQIATTKILWDAIDQAMQKILNQAKIHGEGKMCLLGGIQLNTPQGKPNYFVPIRFDVIDMLTGEQRCCLEKLNGSQTNTK